MGYIRDMINWIVMRIAWLVADIFGWRAALAVFPPFLRVRNHACMNESIMYDEGCVLYLNLCSSSSTTLANRA
jgi:hypothetical protein